MLCGPKVWDIVSPHLSREVSVIKLNKWTILVISVISLSTAAYFLTKKETPPAKPAQPVATQPQTPHDKDVAAAVQEIVPPLMLEFRHEFVGVENLPQVSPKQIQAAGKFILSLEGSPFLSSPADQEIFNLLNEYVSGKRPIHWLMMSAYVQGNGRMGYNCLKDNFAVAPVQGTTELIALSFYHELKHAADCMRYMRENGITDHAQMQNYYTEKSLLVVEKPAYAAQVRFFVALYKQGKLPKYVSAGTRMNDAGVVQQSMEVWQAIYEGTFETWYARVAADPNGLGGPVFMKDLGPVQK